MPTKLSFFLLLIFGFQFSNAQNVDLQEKYGSKYDSCKSQPIIPIIKTDQEIFTKGSMSIKTFQNLSSVALLSTCLRDEFQVNQFRMVGATEHKDPIIVTISGSTISKSDLEKFKPLGNQFQLFIEDIRSNQATATTSNNITLLVK